MSLSAEQIAFFKTNGYLLVPAAMDTDQCARVRDLMWQALPESVTIDRRYAQRRVLHDVLPAVEVDAGVESRLVDDGNQDRDGEVHDEEHREQIREDYQHDWNHTDRQSDGGGNRRCHWFSRGDPGDQRGRAATYQHKNEKNGYNNDD